MENQTKSNLKIKKNNDTESTSWFKFFLVAFICYVVSHEYDDFKKGFEKGFTGRETPTQTIVK